MVRSRVSFVPLSASTSKSARPHVHRTVVNVSANPWGHLPAAISLVLLVERALDKNNQPLLRLMSKRIGITLGLGGKKGLSGATSDPDRDRTLGCL